MDIENNNLKLLQKNVLHGIELLVKGKKKSQYKDIIDIIKSHDITPTKTHHGYLINISDLPKECLLDISNLIDKQKLTFV